MAGTWRGHRVRIGAFNAGLRVAGLGSRFLLSMFMARYMALRDIGTFALMTGVTGLLPSLVGFGLNFFLSRALVGLPPAAAMRITVDRFAVGILAGLAAVAALWTATRAGWVTLPFPFALAGAIMLLELLGFDLQMALLARSRSTFANILLFFRNGAWTIPFMLLAWWAPAWRTIDALAWFWLAGLVASHLLFALVYRRGCHAAIRTARPLRSGFLGEVGARAIKIYASDLGLAGSVYVDRFIITALIDVTAAGIYFFYASIVNAVYVICIAATVQVYQPQLRAAFVQDGVAGLVATMRPRLRTTLALTIAALASAGPATWLVAHLTHKPQLIATLGVLPILLLAYVFKILSEFLSGALAAAEQDRSYALFNILGLVFTAAACVALIPPLGLYGVALANLIASTLLVALRLRSWKRFCDRGGEPARAVDGGGAAAVLAGQDA